MTRPTKSGLSKGEQTRARTIAAASRLFQRFGYHGVGLGQIVEEAATPKGSLYFHFPGGKEELACAALSEGGESFREDIEHAVEQARDPAAAIRAVCKAIADGLAASDFERGCPVATVALEAASLSPRVRDTCAAHYREWETRMRGYLQLAGIEPARAQKLASVALSAVEGAMLLARVQRARAPLLDAGEMIAELVEQALPGRQGPEKQLDAKKTKKR